jgi:hypothetical protein
MIAVVVFLAPRAPFLAAVLFLLGYAIFTVTGGIGTLAFMDIFARTVPFRRRGAFWGLRMFFGSLLSIGVGIFVRHVLRQEWGLTFPNNYAVLMACSFCAFGLAWLTFFFVHEPPPEWTPLPPIVAGAMGDDEATLARTTRLPPTHPHPLAVGF